jgi:voltage-gated potassium channel
MKQKLYEIIFEHDTPAGKAFDVWLIIFVFLSVFIVTLETVESLASNYVQTFFIIEWFFTIVFSIELLVRLYCSPRPVKYLLSFYGLVDFISILPTYVSAFIPGSQSLLVIRALRMLRIFRILKLKNYTRAGRQLTNALIASKPKIIVFLGFITTLVLVLGALMYLIEGKESGFTSIPKSVYWAIVTMTTVGYGDITPQTPLGQILSSALMIIGYGVIAVPTGIISAEMVKGDDEGDDHFCHECGYEIIDGRSKYCSNCGHKLHST